MYDLPEVQMAGTAKDAGVRRFGAFELNEFGDLRKNGMRVRFSGQPAQVLALLTERAGDLVTREELHSKLWHAETFVDFDHGLNNAVARIREILDDSASTPRYVETIPKRGYRFIAPVTKDRRQADPLFPEPETAPTREDAKVAVTLSSPRTREKLAFTHILLLLTAAIAMAAVAIVIQPSDRFVATARSRAVRSLAVLPLKNVSGDPKQEFLSDGMTEELIGCLAGLSDLRVISRTSVQRFKETTLSAAEIAKLLRVDALVEGSIQRQGNRIRIHAQLIRAATDEHFWSATYDREMGDVLGLESEVAQEVAKKVTVAITGQEHARLVAARHVSPDSYESYMKGRFGVRNNSAELEQRTAQLVDSIQKDPTFAPAYVGLAEIYLGRSTILIGASPADMRPKALESAQKALQLDPGLAEAHAIVANLYQKRWHWTDAESEYKRALELEPNSAAAHLGFADWLTCQGRTEEALGWARRARELDPLGDADVDIGGILFCARRYDEAIRELRSVLTIRPDLAFARWSLGRALIGGGKAEEAIPELERTVSIMERSPGALEMLATAYAYNGRRTEAFRVIDELKQRRRKNYVPAGALINPYLALRDYNDAFFWFKQAYDEQSNILQYVKVHPFFDPVRKDPRFQDLLQRVGF